MGRPSAYKPALAKTICLRLAEGETLRAICREDGMPSEATVRTWALDDLEGFSSQYARAREIGYWGMADEILEIADDKSKDTVRDENGNERANTEWITRSRLRVDTRKWLLSKALPKLYGDKIETDLKITTPDGPLDVLGTAQRVAFLLGQGVQLTEAKKSKPLH